MANNQPVTMNDFLVYNTTGGQTYGPNQIISRVQNCNGFTVTNIGTTIIRVNGRILYPGVPGTSIGDSVSIGGNRGEIYTGNINIQFEAGVTPLALVEQKFYILASNQIIY